MLAISKIIGFENSKTPHNGFKVVLNDINSAFPDLFFFVFAPKIDRFLVVSCDVLKPCEESVTIIDGGCARFARGVWCKIFIMLLFSQCRWFIHFSPRPAAPCSHSRVCPSYILQRHGRHIYARS